MKNSKLVEILTAFEVVEFQKLKAFLHSPYFFEQGELPAQEIALYDVLAKNFPAFPESEITKEKVYAELFGAETPKKGKLEKLMSSLFKQVERFIHLEHENKASNDFKKLMALSLFYERKKLSRFHTLTIASLEKETEKVKRKDKEKFYQDFQLHNIISQFRSLYNNRTDDLHLPVTLRALDIFYLAARLELSSSLLAQKNFHNVLNTEEALKFIPSILKYIEEPEFENIPLIQAYAIAYQILLKDEKDQEAILQSIRNLEMLLYKYQNDLPEFHSKALHSFNRSLLIRLINLDRPDLRPKFFEIYNDHLNKGILYHEGKLHVGFLKNLVSLALTLDKTDWVKDLLKKYRNRLCGSDYPEDVYNLNLANYYFHIGDLEKAYDSLAHNYEDIHYKIAAKRLEIMIFYEQESDLLEPRLNAFKLYIHRISKKILTETTKNRNNNFINALKQILSPTNISPQRRERIAQKIRETESVQEREWLLKIAAKT